MKFHTSVGLVGEEGKGHIIAEARFIRIPGSPLAEVGFVVDEKYQRLGIASFLYRMLIQLARADRPDYWPTPNWRTSTPESQGMDSTILNIATGRRFSCQPFYSSKAV